jgi:hypothetical protein
MEKAFELEYDLVTENLVVAVNNFEATNIADLINMPVGYRL